MRRTPRTHPPFFSDDVFADAMRESLDVRCLHNEVIKAGPTAHWLTGSDLPLTNIWRKRLHATIEVSQIRAKRRAVSTSPGGVDQKPDVAR